MSMAAGGANIVCPKGGGSAAAIDIAGLTLSPSAHAAARADIVHQVKGDEAEAVLLLLPDDERTGRVLTAWAARAQQTAALLAMQVTALVQELRTLELYKVPGVSETLDWVAALAALDGTTLDARLVEATLGAALKSKEDIEAVGGETLGRLIARAVARHV
jgi:hypothetical protein